MVELAALEKRYGATHRGFESLSLRQNETFRGIVARMGGFFFGSAEQGPDVFRGGMGIWARQEPRFFV